MKSMMCVVILLCFAHLAAASMGFSKAKKLMFNNQEEFSKQVANGNINPNTVGRWCKKSLLQWAAERGLAIAVDVLMTFGANINFKDSRSKKTPLALAQQNGHEKVSDALIARGGQL